MEQCRTGARYLGTDEGPYLARELDIPLAYYTQHSNGTWRLQSIAHPKYRKADLAMDTLINRRVAHLLHVHSEFVSVLRCCLLMLLGGSRSTDHYNLWYPDANPNVDATQVTTNGPEFASTYNEPPPTLALPPDALVSDPLNEMSAPNDPDQLNDLCSEAHGEPADASNCDESPLSTHGLTKVHNVKDAVAQMYIDQGGTGYQKPTAPPGNTAHWNTSTL